MERARHPIERWLVLGSYQDPGIAPDIDPIGRRIPPDDHHGNLWQGIA